MDDGGSPIYGLILLIACIVINGIFYGFSAAIRNLSESDVERQALEGDRKSLRILHFMRSPAMLVNTIPEAAVLSGMLFGATGVWSFVRLLHPYIGGIWAAVLIIAASEILLVSLGILAFRKVCSYWPERSARMLVRPVRLFQCILCPITWVTVHLSNLVVSLFGINPHEVREDVTEEDLLSVVGEAHEQGVIEESEAEMIQNIIDFGDKEAKDIMTHRKNIVALESDMLLEDAIDLMAEENNSRYPVYEEDIDNIVGIIHLKDVLNVLATDKLAEQKALRDIHGLIREAKFIPETRSISSLFESMQAKKVHMVIVVDEYGQTAGLVAMEDILEEIVGEIQDEYDEEGANIQTQTDNSLLIAGLTPLEEVGEELGISFEDVEFETLNGFLTARLGHIPRPDDREVIARGYRFEILSISNNTIEQVRVEKIKEEQGEKVCQDIQNLPT